MSGPFRAVNDGGRVRTQGFTLGWYVSPFQGRDDGFLQTMEDRALNIDRTLKYGKD